MKRFYSSKTLAEVLASIMVNLTSGWLAILVITPGFFGVRSLVEYLKLLTTNLPLGILGLLLSLWLSERSKSL